MGSYRRHLNLNWTPLSTKSLDRGVLEPFQPPLTVLPDDEELGQLGGAQTKADRIPFKRQL
jgi:hypothetical protein